MSEAVVHPHDEAERPWCAACDTPLHGVFCHECGQHHGSERSGLEFLTRDALAEALSLEGKTASTVRDMFVRPGRLLESYRMGVGEKYFSPFKLFLVMSAAFFVFVTWINVPIYQYLPTRTGAPVYVELIPHGIHMSGVEYRDVFLRPRPRSMTDPAYEAAFARAEASADAEQKEGIRLYREYNAAFMDMNDFWNDWLPRLVWILMPIYALMLRLFFHRRTWAEHAMFTIWAHCVAFAILIAIAGVNLTGMKLPAAILFPSYMALFTFAAARFYGVSKLQAFLRGLGHLAAYAFLWFVVLLCMSFAYGSDRFDMNRYLDAWHNLPDNTETMVIPQRADQAGGGPPEQTVSPPAGSR